METWRLGDLETWRRGDEESPSLAFLPISKSGLGLAKSFWLTGFRAWAENGRRNRTHPAMMLCFPTRSRLSAPNGLFSPLGGDFEGPKALFDRFSPLLASKWAAPFRPGCSLRRPGWSMDGAGCPIPGGGKTPSAAGTPLRPAGCSIAAGGTPLPSAGCSSHRPGCRPLSRREDPAARREDPAAGTDPPARRGSGTQPSTRNQEPRTGNREPRTSPP